MRSEDLARWLRTRHLGREARLLEECPSTQSEALAAVRGGAAHGLLVHAEAQTAGRGRRGRAWQAGAGSLTFSLVIRRGVVAADAAAYCFIAGLALRAALGPWLERAFGSERGLRLKWPNDLWWSGPADAKGRKVGGVLATLETEPLAVVLGVGLNLSFDPQIKAPELATKAASLHLGTVPHAEVLAAVLWWIEFYLARYEALGARDLIVEMRSALALVGEKVRVETSSGILEGKVLGMAHNFSLLLDTGNGATQEVALGDVWPVEESVQSTVQTLVGPC